VLANSCIILWWCGVHYRSDTWCSTS